MKVKEIKEILGNKFLSKARGQSLLLDENIAEKIALTVPVNNEKEILEIGPGLGIITQYLKNRGLHVKAVEIDEDFCRYLESRNIEVINEDFLELEINGKLPHVVAGALPYSVSIPIMLKVIKNRNHFYRWLFVVQKEVAQRITSQPGRKSYSSLSILFQILFEVNKEFDINPSAFFPKPEVFSTVITGKKRENPDITVDREFERFLRDIFRYRRKNLRNNLRDYEKGDISIDLKRRAENLSIEEVITLYSQVKK